MPKKRDGVSGKVVATAGDDSFASKKILLAAKYPFGLLRKMKVIMLVSRLVSPLY